MKIVKLKAENIKKLVAVEIEPTGSVVKITGKNASGKTSVLDSIFWALGGSEGIQDQPIRKGQTKAQVEIDLGEMVVKRTFNDGGTTALTIENKDGLRFKSPQTLLDGLMGRLSFDPLEFMREDPRRQFDTLKTLTGVDFSKLDGMRQKAYDERTAVNRDIKRIEVGLESISVPHDAPAKEVSTTEIVEEIKNVSVQSDAKAKAFGFLEERQRKVDKEKKEIKELQDRIELYRNDLARFEMELQKANAALPNWEKEVVTALDAVHSIEVPDINELQNKLSLAEATNKAFRDAEALRQRKEAGVKALSEAKDKGQSLTDRIDAIDQEKQEMLAKASFPLAELSFGDGSVTYNGLPLSQSSSAEQLQVSMAMAMALNPKLKVLRITDGSLLDSEHMKTIEELATAKDYQVWIEVVDESGKVGVVIEDGQVKTVNA